MYRERDIYIYRERYRERERGIERQRVKPDRLMEYPDSCTVAHTPLTQSFSSPPPPLPAYDETPHL